LDPAGYLKSLGSVRDRSRVIAAKALKNELNHFDVDMQKFPEVVSFVASIIKVRTVHLSWISLQTERASLRLRDSFPVD
jgi:hypothetical protein